MTVSNAAALRSSGVMSLKMTPGFGKSGTSRMKSLRSVRSMSEVDIEVAESPGEVAGFLVDLRDLGVPGALFQLLEPVVDGRCLSLNLRLNRAVVQIGDGAFEPEPARDPCREETITNTLHFPMDPDDSMFLHPARLSSTRGIIPTLSDDGLMTNFRGRPATIERQAGSCRSFDHPRRRP